MPLQHYKTSKTLVATAMLGVFLFHGGLLYGITYAGSRSPDHQIMLEPSTMIMHNISLAGVDDAAEITNQHDDEELLTEPTEPEEEVKEEIKEEIKEEEVVEEKVEEVPEEPVIEEPKEEIITTKQPAPEAPKIQEKKKEQPKPKPQKKKQEAKPQPKRQSKRVENRVFSMQDISVLSKPAPNYPRSVLMRRTGGTTILLIKINEQGKAVSVRIEKSSGNDQIDKAAMTAAHKVRLKPYIVDGKAQSIVVRVPYQLRF
ncbi:energy transducer TonB [Wohlfahrtiimonas larvae]|uniref:TonB C-terminal domain-containing protein n=1 Tax=Wohlfahrtiimonas larvae TaxID=1157986 RepID=A0ABP9MQD5_9GAMM|nr:TonB family protein [Wohlfahrtiimonas larvae]